MTPEARAVMWERDGRWVGRIGGEEVAAASRDECLAALRRRAGEGTLTVEVVPPLAGVAEAARILGAQANLWTEVMEDQRRLDYQAFPRLAAFAETVWSTRKSNWLV